VALRDGAEEEECTDADRHDPPEHDGPPASGAWSLAGLGSERPALYGFLASALVISRHVDPSDLTRAKEIRTPALVITWRTACGGDPMRATFLSLLLLLLVLPAWAEEPTDAELEGARTVLGTYADLVNARQLDRLGTLFRQDVDYRSESWVHVQGVEAIADALREAVAAKPKMRLEIEPGEARRVTPTVIQVDGRYRMWDTPDATPYEGGLTVTCVQDGGAWKIATLRDWSDEPSPRQALFDKLDWLMGSWEGKSLDVPFRVDATLTPGGGFLHIAMEFGSKDEEHVGISTLIGLDASTNTVRSWHFMHDGASGSGEWTVGTKVLEGKVRFVTRDGEIVDSVRRFALRPDGSLVIETKERRMGDEVLPALDPIVLKRAATASEPSGS